MVDKENEQMVRYLKKNGYITKKRVEDAFLKCPRKLFVPEGFEYEAYNDYPLPLGRNSTISASHMVAMMTELLDPKPGEKILEIGMGSGWQACILSQLVGKNGIVVTVEIDKDVYSFGKKNIQKVKCENVIAVHGDGSLGYKKMAPYDGVLVTAAVPKKIPEELISQLKKNGRIVAPIEKSRWNQVLIYGKKINNKLSIKELANVSFVRLRGMFGFK